MSEDTVRCHIHGDRQQAFVCHHLHGDAVGVGFNRNDPTYDNPLPDAWCDDCELIREAHGGWNEQSEKLTSIKLICSGCYERARIRNTHTAVSLDELASLRWKCSSCDEWHTGPCLDFSYDAPWYWSEENAKKSRFTNLLPLWSRKRAKTFLDEDFCAIDGEYFFLRGNVHLPIIGTDETFRWGVWGSLSKANFETLLKLNDDPKRVDLPPMFSWLSSGIAEYPETLSLKMYAHIQEPGIRPHFELELTDHSLAQEYHHGITPERVKAIMLGRLKDCG